VTIPALASVPGLVHGFEQRSSPPAQETPGETRSRVARALADRGQLLVMRQVHGATVIEAPWDATPEADAALALAPRLILGVQTADCLPLLFVDPRRRAVAVAHAGWRGTAALVARRALEALAARGSRPDEVLVALGPGIGACCYEVGDELRAAFGAGGEAFFLPGRNGRPHLDVRAANVRQLLDAGARPERLFHVPDCTRCLGDRYHSYRRDGKGAGRMISFVGFEA
jgi:purine-nucleoside/S-methyl-5'-thioadenosine phosphorylase / adenosine deaminase